VLRNRSVILTPATVLAITLFILCTALQLMGLETTLRFDREAINGGAWWLLLTGNFVHFGLSHLLMNLVGFALIYSLVWDNFNAGEWLFIVVFSSMGVGLGLYFFDPKIFWYVGFSGALHGLIIAGTLADFRRYRGQAALLLMIVVAKLAWEQGNRLVVHCLEAHHWPVAQSRLIPTYSEPLPGQSLAQVCCFCTGYGGTSDLGTRSVSNEIKRHRNLFFVLQSNDGSTGQPPPTGLPSASPPCR